MHRRILALVVGFACLPACGDNAARAVSDASPDSSTPDSSTPDSSPPDASPDAAIPPDAFVDTSLRLRYDFEESSTVVTDTSGRGMNGTLSDVAAWTANGRNGRAIALVGGNPATRYVTLPGGMLTDVDDFTISVWIKYNTLANWARIYDIGNGPFGTGDHWMFLTLNDFDGLHAASFGAAVSNENILASNARFPTGVWKHVALTGSGGNRQLYVDGFPAAVVANGPVVPPRDMEPTSPASWIGRSRFEEVGPLPRDPGLDATLDDFRIYSKVLSQAEIADLAWPQRDYSYWRFDEGSGLTTKDSSENNVATVLKNDATWASGRLGSAVNLPGGPAGTNGPHIELGTNPIASCTTSLTIAAWVKLRTNGNWARVFDFGDGAGTFIFLAPTDGAGMHFAMGKAATPAFDLVATQPLPADDAWHHVAVTIADNGMVNLFSDGTSVASGISATLKPSDYATMNRNWIGRSQSPDPYLNGAIDELRISCRTFTADEIRNLSRP